ncbi:MAG: PP2C family protein-serine/threonine phosphatase [Gemmatirosa sp.]
MKFASPFATPDLDVPGERPRDDELDLYGITHPGRVRPENQDHFLLCTVHPQVLVHGTSLPNESALTLRGQRLATLMLVADGVGGSAAGSTASRLAVEAVTRYVATSLRSYHVAGSSGEGELMEALRAAAIAAHDAVRAEAQARSDSRDMATTLSLGVVIWPWLYVVQVGDSRVYLFQDDELRQLTRDQTLAQELVDQGVLSAERATASPFAHVLSSAIGAKEAMPEITRVDVRVRGCVILVCTDGLTKHVSDAEIADALTNCAGSRETCERLVELTMERGAEDNVTVIATRARSVPMP